MTEFVTATAELGPPYNRLDMRPFKALGYRMFSVNGRLVEPTEYDAEHDCATLIITAEMEAELGPDMQVCAIG